MLRSLVRLFLIPFESSKFASKIPIDGGALMAFAAETSNLLRNLSLDRVG
jgi:hypothetical protein